MVLGSEANSEDEKQRLLGAITGTAVIRDTVGGRICSPWLSVSKCVLYDSRERRQKSVPSYQAV